MYDNATEAAYSVAEAAGWHELVPGIIYREDPLNAEQARAILAQAKQDETYEAPIPEDDAKAIEEATGLVEMAQTAWNQYVRGPEVESILRIAQAELSTNGSSAQAETPVPTGPAAPVEAPPEETPDTPAPTQPTPEPATPAEPEPETPADPQPDPEPEGAAPDLSQIEPWDGYEQEKAADIQKAVEAAVTEYTPDELRDLLANVWAYEHAHKRRVGIIGTLTKVAEKLEAGGATEPGDEAAAAAASQAAAATASGQETPAQPEPPAEEPADPEPSGPPEEPIETPEPETAVETEQPTVKETIDATPDEPPLTEDYASLVATVRAEIEREAIHIPAKPPADDMPEVPWDITKVGDKELQQLHWAFSQAAYYKAYIVQYEERMAMHCRHAADELHRDLLNAIDKHDPSGKEKRVAILEAEIEADEAVKAWRRQQRAHEIYATQAKADRDRYQKLVEQMSRIHTMRQDEWTQAGQKIGRGRPGS